MSDKTSTVEFRFHEMDDNARDAFERYCRLKETEEMTKQSQIRLKESEIDLKNTETALANMQAKRKLELELSLEKAKVEVELAKLQHEVDKIQLETRKLRNNQDIDQAERVTNLIWPRLEILGQGLILLACEQSNLVREELRLIANRNPIDGTSNK
jgi:hypothetical protein